MSGLSKQRRTVISLVWRRATGQVCSHTYEREWLGRVSWARVDRIVRELEEWSYEHARGWWIRVDGVDRVRVGF